MTVGRFFGADAGNVGMLHDANLDGSELTSVTNNMQRFTYSLNDRAEQGTVSGTTLTVRVRFNSDSAQEEMAFDDIVVTGDLPPPTMSFSSGTYSVDEDGTPSGAAVVIERRGSPVGETSIDVTFTSGSALGGDVDFNSTTLTVSFADGETSKTVVLPIIDDELEEGDETFTISLTTNGSNAVLGATTSAVVTILDNDAVSIDAGTSDASSEPTDASTGEGTSDVSTTDNISSAVSSEDLSTDDVTTNDTSTSAPEESTSDARTSDNSSSDSTSSSDVAPIVDAGADAGEAGTPGSSDSCDCRVGARTSSSTGWFGLALTGLVLARLNRRRGNAVSKAHS